MGQKKTNQFLDKFGSQAAVKVPSSTGIRLVT